GILRSEDRRAGGPAQAGRGERLSGSAAVGRADRSRSRGRRAVGTALHAEIPRLRLEACRELPVQRLRLRRFARPALGSLTTYSAEETEAAAAGFAAQLRVGDVVTVSGELGSGKTTFVRGACRALGVEQPVTSPTYTIGHGYHGREVDVSHLDLFRSRGLPHATATVPPGGRFSYRPRRARSGPSRPALAARAPAPTAIRRTRSHRRSTARGRPTRPRPAGSLLLSKASET